MLRFKRDLNTKTGKIITRAGDNKQAGSDRPLASDHVKGIVGFESPSIGRTMSEHYQQSSAEFRKRQASTSRVEIRATTNALKLRFRALRGAYATLNADRM